MFMMVSSITINRRHSESTTLHSHNTPKKLNEAARTARQNKEFFN